jgi:hypothetical protein
MGIFASCFFSKVARLYIGKSNYRSGVKVHIYGGSSMIIAIFFGGIILGFLMGSVTMALFAAASYQNRQAELEATLVHEEVVAGMPQNKLL